MKTQKAFQWSRRDLLRSGFLVGGTAMIGSGILRPLSAFACSPENGVVAEPFPTSPLILNPFRDLLPISPVY
jgi:hypothetical protein